jgi:hypothetical protein
MKAYSDVFGAGHITPELYVKQVFANLSQAEQEREITYLTNMAELDLKQKELALNTAIANFNNAMMGNPIDNSDTNNDTIKEDNEEEKSDIVDNDKNQ